MTTGFIILLQEFVNSTASVQHLGLGEAFTFDSNLDFARRQGAASLNVMASTDEISEEFVTPQCRKCDVPRICVEKIYSGPQIDADVVLRKMFNALNEASSQMQDKHSREKIQRNLQNNFCDI